MKKLFYLMTAICNLITLISFMFIIWGFIQQDIKIIGISLIPFLFYGLTSLSMLLYIGDTDRYEFMSVMNIVNFLLGISALFVIIIGFSENHINYLNWGFPLLILESLIVTSMFGYYYES